MILITCAFIVIFVFVGVMVISQGATKPAPIVSEPALIVLDSSKLVIAEVEARKAEEERAKAALVISRVRQKVLDTVKAKRDSLKALRLVDNLDEVMAGM